MDIDNNGYLINHKCERNAIVIMLPYAGGNLLSYLSITKQLNIPAKIITLSPPGHMFSNEKPFTSIYQLIEWYLNIIGEFNNQKMIFWGHSFGGIVSFELIKKIIERNIMAKTGSELIGLIMTSTPPPEYLKIELNFKSSMSDDELFNQLIRFNYLRDSKIMKKKFYKQIISDFRNDLYAIKSYSEVTNRFDFTFLDVIHLYGKNDTSMGDIRIENWKNYIPNIQIHELPGDHFFIYEFEAIKMITEIINSILSKNEKEIYM
jgi:surfactin synthase thioesterase subunit